MEVTSCLMTPRHQKKKGGEEREYKRKKERGKKEQTENGSFFCLHTCQGLMLAAVSHLYELTVF